MNKKKTGMMEFIKFYKDNGKAFKAYPLRDKSRIKLTLANLKIARLDPLSKIYQLRVKEFNDGMIYHYSGKWLATKALQTKDKETWYKAFDAFKKAIHIADELHHHLDTKSNDEIHYETPDIHQEKEILFSNDIPLVPDITPIVLLQGSSYEMGFQYAEQLVTIYGNWMLERHTEKKFNQDEIDEIKKWEEMHQKYTPEIIDFVRGWVDYSKDHGINLSHNQVMDLWVGHKPPASSYLNAESGIPELPPLACTAIAAWNSATEDGELVVAATGDHDMSYQITIVMYPDHGIPLIFTPFEATGTLPTMGPNWFFGHPGMNLEGLAYVHHGGGPKLLEPISEWGYGIRRGASVLHNLRYSKTAQEAFTQEMEWPIGDIGYGDQATVGGFYADGNYGYVIESRKSPVCVRETGLLGETDYLFSNNSVMHPEAVKSDWMRKIDDLWTWDANGGWRPKEPQGMTKNLAMIFKWFTGKLKTDELMSRGMMFAYWNSYNRNLFLNTMGKVHHGKLSTDSMKRIYRTTGTMPVGDFKYVKQAYVERGEWGVISAAHASNALVVAMKPSEGSYSLCTGPAIRGAAPISPDLSISILNERNAFWDIELDDEPAVTVEAAKNLAHGLVLRAKDIYQSKEVENQPKEIFEELINEEKGMQEFNTDNLFEMNKAIRKYTRIHVIARQFINFYEEPKKYSYK
ncbi:C45 family peptidase [Vallitalea okinawensis]|uniref:hypothetical protein n=1 Tax=Vallitalea okinawensis TaxID=2078660 RepID=UPI000CFC8228|nr:hypothetical protein [Vallitalea okinawensis]